MQTAKQEELAESSALSAKEAMIEETRDKIHALDESVNELQQVLLVTSEELEKLEGRKEVLKERKKRRSKPGTARGIRYTLHEQRSRTESGH